MSSTETLNPPPSEATNLLSQQRQALLERSRALGSGISEKQAQAIIDRLGIAQVQLLIGADGRIEPIVLGGSLAFLNRAGFVVSQVDVESGRIVESMGDALVSSPISEVVDLSHDEDYFIPGLETTSETYSDREFESSRLWREYFTLDLLLNDGSNPAPEFLQDLIVQTLTPPEKS